MHSSSSTIFQASHVIHVSCLQRYLRSNAVGDKPWISSGCTSSSVYDVGIMRALRYTATKNVRLPRICAGYVRTNKQKVWPVASYGTKAPRGFSTSLIGRRIVFVAVGGAFGVGILATFRDDIKHGTSFVKLGYLVADGTYNTDDETGAAAVQRSGRVMQALLLNVNE